MLQEYADPKGLTFATLGGHEGVGEPPPQSEAKDGVGVGGIGVKNAYLAKTGAELLNSSESQVSGC